MSTVKANNYYDASGGSNAQLYGVASPPNSMGFRNRIINGDMRIDQRNAGASVTFATTYAYYLDRWQGIFASGSGSRTVQQSTTAPTGFNNSLLVTNGTGASPAAGDRNSFVYSIEGYNVADLGWGTATAQTVTLSFWVRSSLTGTFSGSFQNGTSNRSYPFTYTINAANTWEQKTVTVAGDTTGTWNTTNGNGMQIWFDLGTGSTYQGTAGSWSGSDFRAATGAVKFVSTSSATWYITGVQLEAGTVASPFERRDYGRELIMCQRYFVELAGGTNPYQPLGFGNTYSTTQGSYCIYLPAPMRAVPSLSVTGTVYPQNLGVNISSFAGPYSQRATIVEGDFTLASASTANVTCFLRFNNVAVGTQKFNFSAEL